MRNKRVISDFMNYISYIVLIFGFLLSLFIFDIEKLEYYLKIRESARYSNESEFINTFVKEKRNDLFTNLFLSGIILIISLVTSINLWLKSFNLFKEAEGEKLEEENNDEENERQI